MDIERNEWIRERAYALWVEQGYPHGLDSQHWAQATAEWVDATRQKPGSGAKLTPAGEIWSGRSANRAAAE
ncbi:DUF2934 domain-containing protein [Neorhizobium alkalisoli]|uniref:DUF2934 family protein n=1 Tax=Neorhizobium alkalisoli TaxID=528178 RepID=A0A561QAZ5_9HYPH|nr:DUF2934 domain-containing protein [Neorhizobium alkalisoli]TWF47533.1 DUF2934 family protein [Neorhizobium alkalisoli]